MFRLSAAQLLEIARRHRARTQGPYAWQRIGGRWHLLEQGTGSRYVILTTVPEATKPGHYPDGPEVLAVREDGILRPLHNEHPDAQALAHSWQDVEDLLQDRASTMELLSRIKEFAHRLPPDIEAELKEAPHGG